MEARIFEFQATYENDLNALREEYRLLYKIVQELRKSALTPELKQKVELLFHQLEQSYALKEIEVETSDIRYRV